MNILFNSGASREAQPDWCHYRRNWQHCHQDDHPMIFMNISAWSFPGEKESFIRWSGNCHQRKTSHLFLIIKDVAIVFVQFVCLQRLQNFFTPQDCRTEKVRIVWNLIHKFLECLWFSFLLKDYSIFPCWLSQFELVGRENLTSLVFSLYTPLSTPIGKLLNYSVKYFGILFVNWIEFRFFFFLLILTFSHRLSLFTVPLLAWPQNK